MKALLDTILRIKPSSFLARFQVISDLHLEVGQQYSSFTFPARAPYLLLCGDIGRLIDYNAYLEFLQSQASRFQKIFLVLGNHEFYGLDYLSGLEKARALAREPTLSDTLVLLDGTRWDDPSSALTVIGCTLWSRIPEDARHLVESKINDFKKIQGWTSGKHNDVVQAAREKRRILVATHHAPCMDGTSKPSDSSNPWTSAFATDLLDQHGWSHVRL